ncbi:MAG: hypothetical protein COV47_05675 [Candidatus Diapherotrites archaeon CG11_big_fil_rev_8_21_14_0_20_37_9]|nr:MAG: hypothetical protein COV47_05675 [Candidatus Diapherotrites archaeon CG11_big_fil_rev_8_21_14_0_20_37_9]
MNAIAVIASFFVSGLGQAIKGHFKRAIAFFVAEAISFVLLFVLIGFITLPIVWIWGMYDAYKLEPKK